MVSLAQMDRTPAAQEVGEPVAVDHTVHHRACRPPHPGTSCPWMRWAWQDAPAGLTVVA